MARLEDLAEELIEMIGRLLDFTDVCNLRLTTSLLASKSSHGHFKEYFRAKRLDPADDTALTTFTAWTESSHVGKLIKSLTLCSVAGSIRSEDAIDTCAESIAQALANLTQLDELILEVSEADENGEQHRPGMILHEYEDGWKRVPGSTFANWRETWLAAIFTFRVTMAALRASTIKVGRLDVFSGIYRCSLSCDQLFWVSEPSTPGFYAQLRSLSLSLSHQLGNTGDHPHSVQQDVTIIAGRLQRLLQQCPLLKSLELHWFKLRYDQSITEPFHDGNILNFIDSAPDFKFLKTCVLRGFRVDSGALLRFLSLAPLQSITLNDLVLRQGSFRPIFDHLQQCALQELHLDNLVEQHRINFRGGGKPRVAKVGQRGPEWIDRVGAKARMPIRYIVPKQNRTRGSWQFWLAPARMRLCYGPPDASAGSMRWMKFV